MAEVENLSCNGAAPYGAPQDVGGAVLKVLGVRCWFEEGGRGGEGGGRGGEGEVRGLKCGW